MRALMFAAVLVVGLDADAQAAVITLTTGESLEVTITARDEDGITVQHPVLGEMTIPTAGVMAIVEATPEAPEDAADVAAEAVEMAETVDGAELAEEAAVAAAEAADGAAEGMAAGEVPEAEQDSPSFWAAMLSDFDSRFEIGISGAEGNTETANIRVGFRTKRENETDRTDVGATYQRSTSSGETIRNQANAFILHDWLIPDSPWFTFVNGNYDFDEFRSWDHRVSGFGGVGYEFITTEDLEVTARLGGGLTKEFGGSDDIRPEALISGALVKWKPTEAQTVSAYATLYPDLSDFFEFRFLTGLEWLIAIDRADGLSLKFGIENEYESVTAGGERHNDLNYYGALVIDF